MTATEAREDTARAIAGSDLLRARLDRGLTLPGQGVANDASQGWKGVCDAEAGSEERVEDEVGAALADISDRLTAFRGGVTSALLREFAAQLSRLADHVEAGEEENRLAALRRIGVVAAEAAAQSYAPLREAGRAAASGLTPGRDPCEAANELEAAWRGVEERKAAYQDARSMAASDEWDEALREAEARARAGTREAMDALATSLGRLFAPQPMIGTLVAFQPEVLEDAHTASSDGELTNEASLAREAKVESVMALYIGQPDSAPADSATLGTSIFAPEAAEADARNREAPRRLPELPALSPLGEASETTSASERSVPEENPPLEPSVLPDLDLTSRGAAHDGPGGALETLLAIFVERGEIGLFELLCSAGNRLGYDVPPQALATLIGTCGLRGYRSQERFREAVAEWEKGREFSDLPAMLKGGSTLLAFAALVPDAIGDPASGARNALRQLDLQGAPEACHALRSAILELGQNYPTLAALRPAGGSADPGRSLAEAHGRLVEHCERAKQKTIAFQAATVVLEALINDPRIRAVLDAKPDDPAAIQRAGSAALQWLADPDRRIDEIDREKRGASRREPIIARARRALLASVDELREHLQDVTEKAKDAQAFADRRRGGDRDKVGARLLTLVQGAESGLDGLAKGGADGFPAGSARCASRLLRALARAFHDGHMANPCADALELDRFRLPFPARDPGGTPEATWDELTRLAADAPRSWLEVFTAALAADEHIATRALIRVARPLAGARDLESERAAAMEAARSRLQHDLDAVKWDLIRAMNFASAGETKLDESRAKIEGVSPAALPISDEQVNAADTPDAIADFPQATRLIQEARDAVRQVEREAIESTNQRIEAVASKQAGDTVEYLRALAAKGDLITLAEELPLVERGQPVAPDAAREHPLASFKRHLRALDGQPDAKSRLRSLALNRGATAAQRSVELARAWEELVALRRSDDSRRKVQAVLRQIGFNVDLDSLTEDDKSTPLARQYRVRTTPIADRRICAVARFGSKARGEYRLILVEGSASAEQIASQIPAGETLAILLWVKGALPQKERIRLARLARENDTAFSLLDTELALFLAERADPLADLFACGIAFGSASPFSTDAGSIPIEIFFGRDEEMGSVRAVGGSCIVYGGRQLGKSVMLDHIAKTQHQPGTAIVRRVDCQARLNRASDIWRIIAETLRDEGVAELRGDDRPAVERGVRAWLEVRSDRRILLMLDETNEFVLRDADDDSREVVALRGLMEATARRCKIVLSGQHNVLRMAQHSNTPLVHFGEPIVIGPLRGADLKAARGLVTDPLAAVGFEFENPRLVSRILAETQYYPKLIQILGENLLRHVRSRGSTDRRFDDLPPWTLRDDDVDAVLRNATIQERLFETFKITLQLDKRYELISLIFANSLYDRKERHLTSADLSVQDLMEQALSFWPEGFPTANRREVVHALLDELVGLGILATDIETGRYGLTSPIIGSMIGRREEVEDRLLAFKDEQPPPRIEPERRRMPLARATRRSGDARSSDRTSERGKDKWPWLSPLTPAQAAHLLRARPSARGQHSPVVVFGAPAMHVANVLEALVSGEGFEQGRIDVRLAGIFHDRTAFARALASEDDEPYRAALIGADTPWDAEWVREAQRSRKRRVRHVFVGDGAHAWRCLVESDLPPSSDLETLGPMSRAEIEDQLTRNNVEPAEALARQLHDYTGGFLAPFVEILKARPAERDKTVERFATSQLSLQDYGLPLAARPAFRTLLSYVPPDEILPMADLLAIEADLGVSARRFSSWLLAIGLAEHAVTGERPDEVVEAMLLNPILRHPGFRRALGLEG